MSSTFVILKLNRAYLKFTVYCRKQTDRHTHTLPQCCHTSVGLAQARPSYIILRYYAGPLSCILGCNLILIPAEKYALAKDPFRTTHKTIAKHLQKYFGVSVLLLHSFNYKWKLAVIFGKYYKGLSINNQDVLAANTISWWARVSVDNCSQPFFFSQEWSQN